MKYNSVLFNKFLNTINNTNTNNTPKKNNAINEKDQNRTESSAATAISSNNMAAMTNSIPQGTLMATSTRFTDEYDLKEELGK